MKRFAKVLKATSLALLFGLALWLCTMAIFSPAQAMNFTSTGPTERTADDSEATISTQAQAMNGELELLIPLYIYPGADWEKIVNASSQVSITVIINPANGPGNIQSDSNYKNGIKMLRDEGVKVLGYVHTKVNPEQGILRNLDDIKDEVDTYTDPANDFDLDGIFFDEVTSYWGNYEYDLDDYQILYDYVKSKSNRYLVVLNPGTNLDESYLAEQAGDTAIIFEGTPQIFNQYIIDSYVSNYLPEQFAMLVHSVSDVDNMQDYLDWAMSQDIRYVYVTSDTLDNPWDTLPSYWEEEVDYIEQSNASSCGGLTQEAEAGALTGLFEIGHDIKASNDQYVHVPNGSGNHKVTYCFTVSTPGMYRIKGKVYAANGNNNSFYVRVDGHPASGYLWDTLKNTTYLEDYVNDRNGDDPVEVELTAGEHIVTIHLREDGTRLDTLELELVETPACGGLIQEAEAGELTGLFEIGHDIKASNNQYVHVPNGSGNHKVTYCFTVSTPGMYRIKGKVYAANGNNDSFYVRVDGTPASGYLWDTLKNTTYLEDYVNDRNGDDPVEVELTAGEHIVTIYLREDGTRLDKLELELVN